MSEDIFELLAPAGSFETFKAVINAGADAVYLGGSMFGARAYANNFSDEELIEALNYAHLRGRKVFLTVNTLLKNEQINEELINYIKPLYENGLDAVLVQDFGALKLIHSIFPDLPIHTSTQMTVTSSYGVKFLQKYGVTRVVMAREVSLQEMKAIHDETGIEIEAFIHGALCYSYSGQCLFSSMLGGRSGNRGRCAQPCRLPYTVKDINNKIITKDTYILSLKDMCTIKSLPDLHKAGVYSLKIEGRMKQTSYAAGVVSYYRKYIDLYLKSFTNEVTNKDYEDIEALGNRCGFTSDYYYKHNSSKMITYIKPNYATSNEELHKNISEKYTQANYININGYAEFKLNDESSFTVYTDEFSYTEKGNIVEGAQKSPVTSNQLFERLNKTGETDFHFDSLEVISDDNIFIPNGEINRLRRNALDGLKKIILSKYIRQFYEDKNCIEIDIEHSLPDQTTNISIAKREQLDVCLEYAFFDSIYLDINAYANNDTEALSEDIAKIRANNKNVFIILPNILRKNSSDKYNDKYYNLFKEVDGFIVRNYESIQFVKESFSDKHIILDHNMYTYNDISHQSFISEGIYRDTVPLELNSKEIQNRNNINSEMIIYGYYPLMTSAQCVNKNSTQCDKISKIMYLEDRYKKAFPVTNICSNCYNIIYNSLPTMLFQNINKIKQYGIKHYRLSFTIEKPDTVRKILDLYSDFDITKVDFEYTNGHFKRGVE